MSVAVAGPGIPIFRSFDETLARAFYVDFLGFEVEFAHRFESGTPLYLSLRLGQCALHLSEHHGDASPGGAVRIEVSDVRAFCAVLNAKNYRHARPGVQQQPWGLAEMAIVDPFHNRVIFYSQDQR